MGYTKSIVKGVSWMAGVRVTTRVLSFAKTIVIARILSPHDFGLFGIATLMLTFVEIFTETGVNIFLVQKKDSIDQYINTAWMVSIVRGILIAAVIALSSVFVSSFFHAPDSLPLLLFIALVPFARGFINPSIIKFQKELLFHKEFIYRTTLFLSETLISIALVITTHRVESLIIGLLISVLIEIFISFRLITPRPRFEFVKTHFIEVISYGKWITGSTIANYFYQHGDDIAVGRMLSTTSLGMYDMAYRLSLSPLNDIAEVITKVTFPVYVRMSDDRERLKKAFIKSTGAVLILTVPIGVVLFLFTREIVSLFLGTQWLAIIPVLKVLAIFGVIRAVSVFGMTFFLSIHKQHLFTIATLIGLAGLVVTIVPLVTHFGLLGAGYSALFGTTLTIPYLMWYIYQYLYGKSETKQ